MEHVRSKDRAIALALLGDDAAALAQARRAVESQYGRCNCWTFLEFEPAFARLRRAPEFDQLVAGTRAYIASERAKLQKLRGAGLVPTRP
jgi:hypothetical protein